LTATLTATAKVLGESMWNGGERMHGQRPVVWEMTIAHDADMDDQMPTRGGNQAMKRAMILRVVTVTVLLSIVLSGVASAQSDLDSLRSEAEAAITQATAELAEIRRATADPNVVLIQRSGVVYPLHRAEIEIALPLFPLYWSASAEGRDSLAARIPALAPALIAMHTALTGSAVTLRELLEMEEEARWDRIEFGVLDHNRDYYHTQDELAQMTTEALESELSLLQTLLTTLDEIEQERGPLEPDVVDEDPDATPVVDEPQEEPSDTSTEVSGFAGDWSTRAGNRMELSGSGSSFKGPYGRRNRADENGVRTLAVAGEMDMQVTGERTLEGFWIKHSRSSVKCTVPKNGSDYWGQQLMVFDEAFMSWKGGWTYCGGSLWRDSDGNRIEGP
jgi:hypothetical protein